MQDRTSCVTAITGVRRAVSRLLTSERSFDRAVDVANITAACKGALRSTPGDHTADSAFASALAFFQRGQATQSQADIVEAQRRLRVAQQLGDALPSGKEQLEKFRKDCA